MTEKTKLTLSDKELSLVMDVSWILTKQSIIEKVYAILGSQPDIIKACIQERQKLPAEIIFSVPKIYKGEHYLQLPYVILDYPRCFGKEDIFAIRTMFWWGHFFSITIHVAGIYKQCLKKAVYTLQEANADDLYIGVNEDPWQHHFQEENYLPCYKLNQAEREALFEKNNFIKLAIKYNLDQWNNIPSLLKKGYERMAMLID